MKVRLEQNWPRDTVSIWLYRGGGMSVEVLELPSSQPQPGRVVDDAGYSWRRVDSGDEPGPPTLELPVDALAELAAAAVDLRPPSREQAAALEDARGTRDRLLSIVEHVIRHDA